LLDITCELAPEPALVNRRGGKLRHIISAISIDVFPGASSDRPRSLES
jgi:hypothetical protein